MLRTRTRQADPDGACKPAQAQARPDELSLIIRITMVFDCTMELGHLRSLDDLWAHNGDRMKDPEIHKLTFGFAGDFLKSGYRSKQPM